MLLPCREHESINVVAKLVPGQKVDRTQFHVVPEEEETHSVVRCSHPHEQHCPERRAEQVLLPRAARWHCFLRGSRASAGAKSRPHAVSRRA